MDIFIYNRFRCTKIECKNCGKEMVVRLGRLDDHQGLCQRCWVTGRNLRNKSQPRYCRDCGVLITQENDVKRGRKTGTGLFCSKCESIKYRKKARDRKILVIDYYGGKCACCGEEKIEFLTIDHKYNDGSAHRKKISTKDNPKKFSGESFYRWIIKNKYPDDIGLRVLCWNCNCSRGSYGYCPHNPYDDDEKTEDYSI